MTGLEALRIVLEEVAMDVPINQVRRLGFETKRRMEEGGSWDDWVRTMTDVAYDLEDERMLIAVVRGVQRLEKELPA